MEMIGVRGRTRALRLGRLREGRGAPHAGRGELVVGDDCCGDIFSELAERAHDGPLARAVQARRKAVTNVLHRSSMFRQKLHINFQLAKEFTIYVTTQGRGNSPTALSVPFL
jgi:hypothetical protein